MKKIQIQILMLIMLIGSSTEYLQAALTAKPSGAPVNRLTGATTSQAPSKKSAQPSQSHEVYEANRYNMAAKTIQRAMKSKLQQTSTSKGIQLGQQKINLPTRIVSPVSQHAEKPTAEGLLLAKPIQQRKFDNSVSEAVTSPQSSIAFKPEQPTQAKRSIMQAARDKMKNALAKDTIQYTTTQIVDGQPVTRIEMHKKASNRKTQAELLSVKTIAKDGKSYAITDKQGRPVERVTNKGIKINTEYDANNNITNQVEIIPNTSSVFGRNNAKKIETIYRESKPQTAKITNNKNEHIAENIYSKNGKSYITTGLQKKKGPAPILEEYNDFGNGETEKITYETSKDLKANKSAYTKVIKTQNGRRVVTSKTGKKGELLSTTITQDDRTPIEINDVTKTVNLQLPSGQQIKYQANGTLLLQGKPIKTIDALKLKKTDKITIEASPDGESIVTKITDTNGETTTRTLNTQSGKITTRDSSGKELSTMEPQTDGTIRIIKKNKPEFSNETISDTVQTIQEDGSTHDVQVLKNETKIEHYNNGPKITTQKNGLVTISNKNGSETEIKQNGNTLTISKLKQEGKFLNSSGKDRTLDFDNYKDALIKAKLKGDRPEVEKVIDAMTLKLTGNVVDSAILKAPEYIAFKNSLLSDLPTKPSTSWLGRFGKKTLSLDVAQMGKSIAAKNSNKTQADNQPSWMNEKNDKKAPVNNQRQKNETHLPDWAQEPNTSQPTPRSSQDATVYGW